MLTHSAAEIRLYKSACRIAPSAWLTGFQKGMPLCSNGCF